MSNDDQSDPAITEDTTTEAVFPDEQDGDLQEKSTGEETPGDIDPADLAEDDLGKGRPDTYDEPAGTDPGLGDQ
jgi:hypothetical protein